MLIRAGDPVVVNTSQGNATVLIQEPVVDNSFATVRAVTARFGAPIF
jgi:hypothetical protein